MPTEVHKGGGGQSYALRKEKVTRTQEVPKRQE